MTNTFTYTAEEKARLREAARADHLRTLHDTSVYERDDLGFSSNRLIQATLPYTDTGESRYVSRNGNLTVTITSLGSYGLPYGVYPRLLLLWLTTAVIHNAATFAPDDPERLKIHFGSNLSAFMHNLGIDARYSSYTGADGKRRDDNSVRMQEQIKRLFNMNINVEEAVSGNSPDGTIEGVRTTNTLASQRLELFWSRHDSHDPAQASLLDSYVVLSADFFNMLASNPVPLDMGMIRALKRSPMALDVFCWTSYRASYAKRPFTVPVADLMRQFGTRLDPDNAGDRRSFMQKMRKAVEAVHKVWPESGETLANGDCKLQVLPRGKGIMVYPFRSPAVPKKKMFLEGTGKRKPRV